MNEHIKRFGVLVMAVMLVASGIGGALAASGGTNPSDGNYPSLGDIQLSADGNGNWTFDVTTSPSSNGTVAEVALVLTDNSTGEETVYIESASPTNFSHTFSGVNASATQNLQWFVVEEDGDLIKTNQDIVDESTWESGATTHVLEGNTGPTRDGLHPPAIQNDTAEIGEKVTVEATGINDEYSHGLTYSFDFDGDGTFEVSGSESKTTTTSWNSSGTKNVTVRATDITGMWYDFNTSIDIQSSNSAPTADAGPNQTVQSGDSVTFDGSGSSDPDGDTLSYSWDFDGDGVEDATGVSPTHSLSSTGTYTVELTVTDPDGASDTDTMTVTVEESTYEQTFDVTDANGSAVANATVDVTDDSTGTTVATLTTDSNGSGATSLADGNYSYSISATEFDTSTGSFSVAGASQTHNVTLAEATATYNIIVDVVDSNGSAVENATVELPGLNVSATTDSNGSASFTGIEEGTHNVTVTSEDGSISVDEDFEVDANNTEFEVVLSESGGGGGAFIGSGIPPAVFIVIGGGVLVLLLFAAMAGADP
ncbi:PKD domain-containing protein [Halorussus salinisoli]|uniref:PKD domain-containing protein n=1 Tax=Halorussus salinisoli TaxID=2558242 RepID=UPI0010C20B19|nr:PKD domain-containing protein [Halorussus salinisoli]